MPRESHRICKHFLIFSHQSHHSRNVNMTFSHFRWKQHSKSRLWRQFCSFFFEMKAKNNNLRMASISRIACLAWKRRTQTNEKAKLKEINHKPKDKLCYVMNFRVFFLFVCFFADSKFNFWANKYCWHCHFLLVSMLHTLHTLRILMLRLYWIFSS